MTLLLVLRIISIVLILCSIKVFIDMMSKLTMLYSDKYSLVYRFFPRIKAYINAMKTQLYFILVIVSFGIIINVVFFIK